jgi:DNA-directed RNA polymerase subunit RPC12/RpoP
MVFIAREESFICGHCGSTVEPLIHGSYRNHCPFCLYSKHVDKEGPGDRASDCLSLMKPKSLDYRSNKGWIIIHECIRCHKIQPNKSAPDDEIVKFQTGSSSY